MNKSTKNSKYRLKAHSYRLSESAKDEKYFNKEEKKDNNLIYNLIKNVQQFSNSNNNINNINNGDINNNNYMKNGKIIKIIVKQYIDREMSLSEIDSSLKKQK